MTVIGYARVSTTDQDLAIQEAALKIAGCELIRAEKRSGKTTEGRTELQTILEFLREGDVLMVTRIDRLARSIGDLQDIVRALKAKGAALKATEQPIDTGTAAGKAFLDMLGVFAEFETNLRRERQMEGIAKAKAAGVYKGRKSSIDPSEIARLKREGVGASEIARRLKIGRASVDRARQKALGDWGEKKAITLLERAGFRNVRDMNAESANHPFGDILAERGGVRYLIGVKTRNKYQASGLINPTYNVRKRGADVDGVARRHGAILAWVAIAVVPEAQAFSAFFDTIDKIESDGERFSIPMKPERTDDYECLSQPREELDRAIRPEWSNGGYARRQTKD